MTSNSSLTIILFARNKSHDYDYDKLLSIKCVYFLIILQLIEAANGETVWLDYTLWLPGSPTEIPIEPTTDAATTAIATSTTINIVFLSTLFTLVSLL